MSKKYLLSLIIACGMLWMSSVYGFSIRVHLEVTYNELAALSAEIKGDQVGFSERAMEQVADANEAVDSVFAGSAALFRPERHFTDSRYRDSTQRMIDLRQQILDQVRLTPPDGHTARQRLNLARSIRTCWEPPVEAWRHPGGLPALGTGVVIHVATPEPGTWNLGVEGNGEVSLSVQGNSPVSLDHFAFVEANPDEDVHGGFFPIPGQPVAGIPGIGEAALLGPVASAGFSMVDLSGNTLGIVYLTQDHPDGNPRHHIGEFELPTVPFRVMARGTDPAGLIYQRLYPVVFRAQPLGIAVLGTNNLDVAPGSSGQLDFLVTNHGGSPMTLNTAASDELGFATDPFPGSLTLASGEHAEVSVEVTVPEGVDSDTISVLTMTASNINDVTVFNSATAVISVVAEPALDCSPADSMSLQLWPPNHHFAEVDPAVLGAVEHDPEMEIAYEIISITQDEPVTGPGSGNTAPDGQGIGSAVGEVRAERNGDGNGRVYNVGFRAYTAGGGQCESFIRVEVPLNPASEVVDDGQLYDSTAE